jgi:hypothetical protein
MIGAEKSRLGVGDGAGKPQEELAFTGSRAEELCFSCIGVEECWLVLLIW